MRQPAGVPPRLACALLAAIAAAACQTSNPRVLGLEGARSLHNLREEPHRAAVCIARNVDRLRTPYSAQIAPGVAPVMIEVHVRGQDPVVVAQLSAAGAGSSASVWLTPEPFFEREAFVSAILADC